MKFGQFRSYSKINNFIEKFYKNYGLKISSRPFSVCKELSKTSIEKRKFLKQSTYSDVSRRIFIPVYRHGRPNFGAQKNEMYIYLHDYFAPQTMFLPFKSE